MLGGKGECVCMRGRQPLCWRFFPIICAALGWVQATMAMAARRNTGQERRSLEKPTCWLLTRKQWGKGRRGGPFGTGLTPPWQPSISQSAALLVIWGGYAFLAFTPDTFWRILCPFTTSAVCYLCGRHSWNGLLFTHHSLIYLFSFSAARFQIASLFFDFLISLFHAIAGYINR